MTRLGNDRQLRKSGRYARVMGTLWRHPKREKCGRGAMGLLLDIWSHCADQSEEFISEKGMRRIINGDPNGRRQLKELVDAQFIDRVDGGYVPHDWSEHSAFGGSSDAPATGDATRDATQGATRDVTRDATGDVMNAPPENTGESDSSRAGASLHVSKSPSLQVLESDDQGASESEGIDLESKPANTQTGTAQPDSSQQRITFKPDPESAWAQHALIRDRFEAGLKHATKDPDATATWGQANHGSVLTLSDWLDKRNSAGRTGDARKILDRALKGFFADAYAAQECFPVALLAKNPDKYFKPPQAPAPARASPNGRPARMQPAPGTEEHDFPPPPPDQDQFSAFNVKR